MYLVAAVIVAAIIVPALLIGLAIHFIGRRRRSRGSPGRGPLPLSLSPEDEVSQLLLALATLFLAVTIFAWNRNAGAPLSWWTVFLACTGIGLASAYTFRTPYTLALSLIALAAWWGARAAFWIDEFDCRPSPVFSGLLLIMLVYTAVGHAHGAAGRAARFSTVYRLLGAIPLVAALFFLSTKPGLGALEEMTGGGRVCPPQVTASLFLLTAALGIMTLRSMIAGSVFPSEVAAAVIPAALFVCVALVPGQETVSGGALTAAGIAWACVFNIVVFLHLLGLILSGYRRREEWLINMGTFFLFLLIAVKYIDWFFTFLDKSLFFIGAGALLFLVGWLMERGRRQMIAGLRGAGGAGG